jgi:cytochrome b561
MQPISAGAINYDNRTILFHWLIAILVTVQWLGAQTIDRFPRGVWRTDVRSLHITLGVVIGVVLAARIVWRLTEGRRLPPADKGILQFTAKFIHFGLYACMIAMVLVGLALAWTRGDNIFNLFTIPAFEPGNKVLPNTIQDIHATIGWMIVAGAGIHASAALVHYYVFKDRVLGRMFP